MQFCLLNGIKKTDRRLIKRKVLWRLFPMLRYLYWLPELQWQQLELCLELFLPIDYCHSLAIFWEKERFFPWLQCCLYFHAFCIYQMVSALRKKEKVLWHMMPDTDMSISGDLLLLSCMCLTFFQIHSMLFRILDMNTDFQKQTLPGVILTKLFTNQIVN